MNTQLIRPLPSKLLLHHGDCAVHRDELVRVPTPKATETWQPIAHVDVLHHVEKSLFFEGFDVVEESHGLSHDNARYFGLLQVQGNDGNNDYSWVVGIRNSHDKRFSAGIVAGCRVLVCSNLSFSGEIKLARKHTRRIEDDLPNMAHHAVGQLKDKWHRQDQRIDTYMRSSINDVEAHDLVIRGLDEGACCSTQVPKILQEWRQPSHRVFAARNVWSLFNAFTEVLKGNLNQLPQRTEALHRIADAYVGLN